MNPLSSGCIAAIFIYDPMTKPLSRSICKDQLFLFTIFISQRNVKQPWYSSSIATGMRRELNIIMCIPAKIPGYIFPAS